MSNMRVCSLPPVATPDLLQGLEPPGAGGVRPGTQAERSIRAGRNGGAGSPAPDLLGELVRDLLKWEGQASHMYKDTRGFVTVGIGNLLSSSGDAERLPFVHRNGGLPASRAEIAEEFDAVRRAGSGRTAGSYQSRGGLRLPDNVVQGLARQRLNDEFLPGLRRIFPDFDGYPTAARRALVDMAYNLGVAGLARFHQLRTACEGGDWQTAASECHRRTCRAERNDWTRDLFLQAGRTKPVSPPSS